jgi:hypothetical protein
MTREEKAGSSYWIKIVITSFVVTDMSPVQDPVTYMSSVQGSSNRHVCCPRDL